MTDVTKKAAEDNQIKVRSLPIMKLKDKANRHTIILPLRQAFGFLPEVLIIKKVPGENNKFQIHAQLTDEVLAEIKKIETEKAKKQENAEKAVEHIKEITKPTT